MRTGLLLFFYGACFFNFRLSIKCFCSNLLYVYVQQDSSSLRLPPGLRSAQHGHSSRPAHCSGGYCRCLLPIPGLHRRGLCPVLCCCYCCSCSCRLRAVPLCCLPSSSWLHDHSRVWLRCAAATGSRCHPRSSSGGCSLWPVPDPAAPDRPHAVSTVEAGLPSRVGHAVHTPGT